MRISDWSSDVCSSDLLRRKVLQVAKAEIDQLAHFTVEWDEIRRGRAVIELAFRFAPKDAPAQIETVDELARHTSRRTARQDDNEIGRESSRERVCPTGSISVGAGS